MVFAKISLVLVFFLIPILVQATGVFESDTDHNAYFWCSSTGYDSGDAISGTNVNLPFDGWILLADTGDPYWTDVQLLSVKVELDDMPDQTLYPGTPNPNTLSKTLRIASTHYADGTSITMKVTANVAFSNGTTSSTDSVSCELELVVYNKGLVLATKEDSTPSGYVVNTPPDAEGYAENAVNAMPYAKTSLATMKHSLLNPSGDHFLRETELASKLDEATTCFFFTHGEPGLLRSSEIDELEFAYSPSTPSEVRGYVTSNRVAPQPNIVVMHACSTLAGSGNTQWHAPYAFAVANVGSQITARGYAGFTSTIYSLTAQGTLTEHAKRVYEKLAAGSTLKKAVAFANELEPFTIGEKTVLMVIRGDNAAKLVGVYTGDPDLENTNWWVIL